ncbi:hypothetical protein LSM04_005547 [Trypanosoma melophagium]|uniref:uncharacterized protein n=1 Tax=Trypanosoma melophagium TaxID=715481 RepID=UPI00351A8C74|nr:hypothetical protein LSM04_005547 [Trypanosoma melophagium]
MGSSASTGAQGPDAAHDDQNTTNMTPADVNTAAAELEAFKQTWEKQFVVAVGELECVSSGYTSFADYNDIAETLKKICREVRKERTGGNTHTPASSPYLRNVTLFSYIKMIAEHMPCVATFVRNAPRYMVIESIMGSIAGLQRDTLETSIAPTSLEVMSARAEDNFKQLLEKTVPYLHRSVRVMPISIIGNKNNYFAPSEPILAPYISRNTMKNNKVDFFVSLKDRIEMLNRSKSFRSEKDILQSMKFISGFISDMLSCFSLRIIFYVAKHIRAKRREIGDGVALGGRMVLKGLEEHALKLCHGFEDLAKPLFKEMRRQYPHIFVNSDYLVHWSETDGWPPSLTVIMNILIKMLFLFAGGSKSIAADDLRPNEQNDSPPTPQVGSQMSRGRKSMESDRNSYTTSKTILTEDLALASSLRIEAIGWTTIIIKLFRSSSGIFNGRNSSDAVVCSNVLRTMYQFMGVLPFGSFCPAEMVRWIEIFPLYTLREEEMHTMLQLYCQIAEQETQILRPIDCFNVFDSLTRSFQEKAPEVRKRSKESMISDLIVPGFEGDLHEVNSDIQWRRHCRLLYNIFATECVSTTKLPLDITDTVKVEMRKEILGNLLSSELEVLKTGISASRMGLYSRKTGARIRWENVENVRNLRHGDALKLIALSNESATKSVENSTVFCGSSKPNNSNDNGSGLDISITSGKIHLPSSSVPPGTTPPGEIHLEWTISWACKLDKQEYLVVFDSEEPFPSDVVITSVKLLGRNTPIFNEIENRDFAWTNSKYVFHRDNSTTRSIPFMLGWLLGNSFNNEVQLQIPMAPLAFRMMRRMIREKDLLADWNIRPADLMLVSQELFDQLKHLDGKHLQNVMEHVGNQNDVTDAKRLIGFALRRACDSLLMNVRNDPESSVAFWEEVARGLEATPVANSPLLDSCCSRIVRNVLCGKSLGNEYRKDGFRWEDHFVFLCSPELGRKSYADDLRKAVIQCLNKHFVGDAAREVLLFLIGEPRLPSSPLTECVILKFPDKKNIKKGNRTIRMLPAGWPGHYILELPFYMKYVLRGPRKLNHPATEIPTSMSLQENKTEEPKGSADFAEELCKQLHEAVKTVKPYPNLNFILQQFNDDEPASVSSRRKTSAPGVPATRKTSEGSVLEPSTVTPTLESIATITDESLFGRVGETKEKYLPINFSLVNGRKGKDITEFGDNTLGTWGESEDGSRNTTTCLEDLEPDAVVEIISKPPRFLLQRR